MILGDYLCRSSRMQFSSQPWKIYQRIYLDSCDLRKLDSPDKNEANFEEVLGLFENDIASVLVCLSLLMLYHYGKIGAIYACLFVKTQFIVPINKASWATIYIQLCDYSTELRYSRKDILYQNHYLPSSSEILWYQVVAQRYAALYIQLCYITDDIMFYLFS